ncbi:MAG: hypothetical protein ABIN01_14215 [Ferruginibacter sp.]
MNKIYNRLSAVLPKVRPMLLQFLFKNKYIFPTLACLYIGSIANAQTNNYFGTTGILSGAVWSVNPAGPYTSLLNTGGGAIINFDNAATVTGATLSIAGINANADVIWSNGGTVNTGGTVAPITVANGATLNMSQTLSTAGGTGFTKSGGGVLVISVGSAYPGGFTLTNGTFIAGGVNAMGGNAIYLNGGILASNANRDFTGQFSGGISIGGNVQFGEAIGLANSSANLTFSNNISLGAASRILTMGNAGITTLGGIINGSAGISFTANTNGASGLFDITNTANTFTGAISINGGKSRFAGDGSFGNASNPIILDGGQLATNATFSIVHGVQLGTTAGTGITVSPPTTLTIAGIIADNTSMGSFTEYGTGTLVLTGANTFTGTTYIDATGGTLQLNRAGGNTLPTTNSINVNGGILKISSDQTLNNLSLINGNLTIDNGVILTINGTFDFYEAATITLSGSGRIIYGPSGTLKYSGTATKVITAVEFPVSNGPANININNSGGVSLAGSRTITGSLQLVAGILTINAGGVLDLNNASLNVSGGSMTGNANADLMVRGTTGGTVTLPANINLRNITVSDTRTLALNGTTHLNLYGTLLIEANAVFDNGGESQVINGGGSPVINIYGKFVNRDKDNFTGTNGAIPGILPTLNTNCTIEYGLAGNQVVNSRNDYSNITFSGSGTKTLASGFNPQGTVYITGTAIADASNKTFGDAFTNLSMDGGRLYLAGTNNPQPHMAGTYSLTGGVVEFACNSISGQTIRNRAYQNIEVSGLYVGNSNGNITLNNNGTFIVKAGGAFEINDNSIIGAASSGGQSVVVENNGTFLCGNNQGFNGYAALISDNSSIHANITNITLATGTPGSTVNYTRPGDQPITIANGLAYNNLTLSGTGKKIAPSATLAIKGNLLKTGGGTFNHNNGHVVFNSSGSLQSFTNSGSTFCSFYDITNNTSAFGLNIENNIGIANTLTLSVNSILNLVAGDITMLSTAINTSRVATVPISAAINYNGTGRFNVERYFPADRSWRLITSPLSSHNTPTTIFSQWQNSDVYTPGKGTFVTGQNPNSAINGLDDSNLDNYSLKTFQNNAYVNIGNTLTPLSNTTLSAANIGYFIFVRGDRNRSPDNTIFPNTNATTLTSRGKLQTGTQAFSCLPRGASLSTRLYTLVGNPYASPVNFKSGVRNNVVNRFTTWDPQLNVVGGFVTADDFSNSGTYTFIPFRSGGQDEHVQSSQAIFVETDSVPGAASLTFNEMCKSTVYNMSMFRPVSPSATASSFKSSLYLLNIDNTTTLVDENLVQFKGGFNDAVDFQDALKFGNVNETFGLLRNRTLISIERRPTITVDDTLYFNLARMTARNYQLEFLPTDIDPLLVSILEDRYLNTKIPISIATRSTHTFNVNADVESAASDRFRIIFKLSAQFPLPVAFSSLKAFRDGDYIAVEWVVESEVNMLRYEVEKSTDGVSFIKDATIIATGPNGSKVNYRCVDNKPADGNNYYRIRSIDKDGSVKYTSIVLVKLEKTAEVIIIYPNPVTTGVVGLKITHMLRGLYQVKLLNNAGQTIVGKMIKHAPGTTIENLRPSYKLAAGIYQLEVITPAKKMMLIKVVIK